MRYMLLIYQDETALTESRREACYAESHQLIEQVQANGQFLAAAPLYPTTTATSVRIRDGKRFVTDGPFAETHEQLGGYYLIDAPDLDEAVSIAARIPGARNGTIEVRPVIELANRPVTDRGNRSRDRLRQRRSSTGISRSRYFAEKRKTMKPSSLSRRSLSKSHIAGWVISILAILFMVMDGVMKLVRPAVVTQSYVHLGFSQGVSFGIGTTVLVCTLLYAIPRSAVLGAILLTGFLGGATAVLVRVGDPFYFPIIFGALVWGGLYLRDERLRALIPLRS